MIDTFIRFCINRRWIITGLFIFICIFGYYSWTQLTIDAYPDIAVVGPRVRYFFVAVSGGRPPGGAPARGGGAAPGGGAPTPPASSSPPIRSESWTFIWHPNVRTW
jgi:hypothetical protein